MNRKKFFGLFALVLISVFSFIPTLNCMVIASSENNNFVNEYNKTAPNGWDLKITIKDIVFKNYDNKLDIAYYKIKYEIENIGDELYIGYPKTVLKVHQQEWEIASWHWVDTLPLTLWPGGKKEIIKVQKIEYENEQFLSGRKVDLVAGRYDSSGSEDPYQDNNKAIGFGNYWKPYTNGGIPSGNHLKATLPNNEWIDDYHIFDFPEEDVKVPIFSENYEKFVIPTFLSSERIGWIGNFINLFISTSRAFCNFSSEFFDVASLMAITAGELYLLISEVIGTISAIAQGKVLVTFILVSGVFVTLATIAETLERLLGEIQELPLDPNNPLRVELADSVDSLYTFISNHPWNNDIIIKGEINNCKPIEDIKISCRNVSEKEIPGSAGQRQISPFPVSSYWKLEYLDSLFFRCCQVVLKGDGHIGQKLKTRKIFSYVAPGGSLNVIAGFQNVRVNFVSKIDLFQSISPKIPILKQFFPFIFDILAVHKNQ